MEIADGAPEEVRTPNLLIRSQVLYPVELRALAAIGMGKIGPILSGADLT